MARTNSDHHSQSLNEVVAESPQKHSRAKSRHGHVLDRGRSQDDLRSEVGSSDSVKGFMSDP